MLSISLYYPDNILEPTHEMYLNTSFGKIGEFKSNLEPTHEMYLNLGLRSWVVVKSWTWTDTWDVFKFWWEKRNNNRWGTWTDTWDVFKSRRITFPIKNRGAWTDTWDVFKLNCCSPMSPEFCPWTDTWDVFKLAWKYCPTCLSVLNRHMKYI